MFHNVLVGIDGSPAGSCALNTAIEIARDANARLTVLTAVGRMPALTGATGDATTVAQLTHDLRDQALRRLDDAVAQVPDEVPVTKLLSLLPVPEALLSRVSSGCHDVVVIGTRGRRGIRAALSSSVSRQLVRRCPVPVLVVHADAPARPQRIRSSRRSAGLARPEELLA
jgi:nucleotide-binding universal stress UspA family protein